jgi:hypothetical protein
MHLSIRNMVPEPHAFASRTPGYVLRLRAPYEPAAPSMPVKAMSVASRSVLTLTCLMATPLLAAFPTISPAQVNAPSASSTKSSDTDTARDAREIVSIERLTLVFAKHLERATALPALDAEIKQSFGDIDTARLESIRSELRAMQSHPRFAAWLAKTYHGVRAPGLTQAFVKTAAHHGLMQLQTIGATRLDAQQQWQFFNGTLGMRNGMTSRECRNFFLGNMQPHELSALKIRYLRSLAPQELASLIRTYRRAVELELDDAKARVVPTAKQENDAEEAHGAILLQRLQAKLQRDVALRLAGDPSNGTNDEVCTFMSESINAVTFLREPFRQWKVSTMILSMSR